MAEDSYLRGEPSAPLPERRSQLGPEMFPYYDFHSDQEAKGEGFNLATVLHILWTRGYWILVAGALGLAVALIISLFEAPLYRSTAVLELNPPTVPILPGGSEQQDNLVVPNTDREFLATQYGLLKSRALSERVVQDLNLAQDERGASHANAPARMRIQTDRLSEGIEVQPVRASRLVKLSYTSENPATAARIVNGFADAFLSSTLDRRFEATAMARQFLKKRLSTVRVKLDEAERNLVAYAKANNIIDTSGGTAGDKSDADSLSGASLVALNSALAQAEQKRIAAEQRFRQSAAITEVNQSTASLRQEKARLEAEYQEKAATFRDDYPEMVSLRSRISSLDKAIRREAGNASGALHAEYQAALAEEGSLRAKVRQLSATVLDQRERAIQYNMLQRELDTNRSLYDALLARYNQVGVAGSVGTPQASIVDRGEIPVLPSSPNIPLNLGLGLIVGLALGVALAFGHEYLTDTVKSPEDVREKLRLQVLGVVPRKRRRDVLAEQVADRKSPISEAYASLLTTLQFAIKGGLPRSLLVTSTKAGEGKSTTSFVLANNLAKLGKRVLLMDADMRRPSFIVEEKPEAGISRLLLGNSTVSEHILGTHIENLWLMPAGPIPADPAQLLNTPRLAAIMQELSARFDFVIVDAQPTHGYADAPLLASVCDAVLIIVESGKTRRRHALEAISKLHVSGSPILGVALTKYESSIGEYGYGYGYYSSYRAIDGKPKSHELTSRLMGADEV